MKEEAQAKIDKSISKYFSLNEDDNKKLKILKTFEDKNTRPANIEDLFGDNLSFLDRDLDKILRVAHNFAKVSLVNHIKATPEMKPIYSRFKDDIDDLIMNDMKIKESIIFNKKSYLYIRMERYLFLLCN